MFQNHDSLTIAQWLIPIANTYKFLWYVNFADVTNPVFLQFSCEGHLLSKFCGFCAHSLSCMVADIIDAHMAWLKVSCNTSSSIWSRTLPLVY